MNYQTNMNEEEDKILMAYGKILESEGLIKNKITRYSITKFILTQAVTGFKDQLKKEVPKTSG